jgi:hypothetical protein
MLGRVSSMSLRDYLGMTRSLEYCQFLIGRKGRAVEEICDLDGFLADWTNPIRIEDFAFVPREKADEVMAGVTALMRVGASA